MGHSQSVLTLGILSLLLTGVFALLVHPFDPDRTCCDHLFYRSMSFNLFTVTRPDLNVPPPGNPLATNPDTWWTAADQRGGLNRFPPYEYRIVTPLLARAISYATGINAAYYLISFLALAGAAFLVSLSILELVGLLIPAAAGAVLFLVNPQTASFNLREYMLVDPAALFFATLAIWALVKRKRFLFFVTCAVGILNKESLVPLLVAYPLMEALIERKVRWSTVAAAVGIGIGWHLFRVAMPEAPGTTYNIVNQLELSLHHAGLVAKAAIIVYGVTLAAIIRRPWGSKLIIALVPFGIVCFLEGWFVIAITRVMAQALPAVCLAILWRWPTERREQILTLAVVPLVAVSALAYDFGAPHPFWITLALSVVAAGAELRLASMRANALPGGPETTSASIVSAS